MRGQWLVGFVVVGVVALAGCSKSADVTLYKPGVYKGPVDPLLEKQRSPQQQEALLARFNQVQTDR
ncbi:MAG TPA: hypothetical protein VFU39_08400 [Sulfuricaulis sp.]|jgi:hypothetical protein|nr:hypothetical protein [Sulfuricaulis sp.]